MKIAMMLSPIGTNRKFDFPEYRYVNQSLRLVEIDAMGFIHRHTSKGCAFMGSLLSQPVDEYTKTAERYLTTSLFCLDFDNGDYPLSKVLTDLPAELLPLMAYPSMSSTLDHPRFHLIWSVKADLNRSHLDYNRAFRHINKVYCEGSADKQAISALKLITGANCGCDYLNLDQLHYPVNIDNYLN